MEADRVSSERIKTVNLPPDFLQKPRSPGSAAGSSPAGVGRGPFCNSPTSFHGALIPNPSSERHTPCPQGIYSLAVDTKPAYLK